MNSSVDAAPAPTLDAFRDRARAWLAAWSKVSATQADADPITVAKAFQADLYDQGFAGIALPREWGGMGLGPQYQQAFDEEAAGYDLPVFVFMVGMGMCAPTLIDLGTDAQRERYVRPLLRGEEIWSQLFSEPSAGSDIAGLHTRAVLDGDEWVITGQKVWTSRAQYADFGSLLARTDPSKPKHEGLTMFILDMHAPGVTVRPLPVMSGRSPFNEVFLDEVRIPRDRVIGDIGGGWPAALTMLGHERRSLGARSFGKDTTLAYESLVEFARDRGALHGGARDRLVDLYASERAIALLNARMRAEARAGRDVGARGSVTKLTGALLLRQATAVFTEIAGASEVAWDDDQHAAFELAIKSAPSSGIAGGTNEIQRNIIGERLLGLPREPSVERGRPFSAAAERSDA